MALETSFLDEQTNPWEEEERLREESLPKSKRSPFILSKDGIYVAPLALKHANLQFVLVLMNDDVQCY